MSQSCNKCQSVLNLSLSVNRKYISKRGPEDGSEDVEANGHYDEKGNFISEEFQGFDSEGSYDLTDGSDTCAECNEIIQ